MIEGKILVWNSDRFQAYHNWHNTSYQCSWCQTKQKRWYNSLCFSPKKIQSIYGLLKHQHKQDRVELHGYGLCICVALGHCIYALIIFCFVYSISCLLCTPISSVAYTLCYDRVLYALLSNIRFCSHMCFCFCFQKKLHNIDLNNLA